MSAVDFTTKITKRDSALISDLYKLCKKSPKLVKHSDYVAPNDTSITLTSWKMNEFKYYDVPSPFPTLARGLFTQEIKDNGSREDDYRIVARGYDKFFNIGEVPWTTWAALEENTEAPYTLTLKSNGCIIFIAALTPKKLVVTSKHALGSVNGVAESHSQVGERWLQKHLADVQKTTEELAAVLWEKNWTAVAELCDDSFEEHVLPYAQDKTGLHLHGLNANTKQFHTMLPDVVESFAREWGFIVTPYTTLNTIPEVKSFTEQIGKSGEWNGEALEGFVVRTHISGGNTSGRTPGSKKSSAPYPPGSSFFFKVKFDEPYMMYRDWREVTKSLLSKGPKMANVPKSKLRRQETKVYAQWIIDEIERDRSQFALFAKGKGIIATRERFLKWYESEEGKKRVEAVQSGKDTQVRVKEAGEKKPSGKTIIVPVAIPGCGKTSVAVALTHLFGFGHTQSDDIKAKKPGPVFIQNVTNLLKKNDVVIADKNNHLKQHRRQIREIQRKFPSTPIRLIALNWSFDLPRNEIQRICSDRILSRGEKHQTLRPDGTDLHEKVLRMFISQAEALEDNEVDVVVPMDLGEDLEGQVKRAVDACVEELGVERPDMEKIGEALGVARNYTPKVKQDKKGLETQRKQGADPRYYAITPEGIDVQEFVGSIMENDEVANAVWSTWTREQRKPHATIVHVKAREGENQWVWEACKELNRFQPVFQFRLGSVLWDDRVMALTVEDLSFASPLPSQAQADEDGEEPEAQGEVEEFLKNLPGEIRDRLHITIGMKDKSVLPVEARDLVGRWKEGKLEGINEKKLVDVWGRGRLQGLFS